MLHDLVGQLRTPSREPPVPRIELQQDREAEPGGASLPGDQLMFLVQDRPVLDQLVDVHRGVRHSRPASTSQITTRSTPFGAHDTVLTGTPFCSPRWVAAEWRSWWGRGRGGCPSGRGGGRSRGRAVRCAGRCARGRGGGRGRVCGRRGKGPSGADGPVGVAVGEGEQAGQESDIQRDRRRRHHREVRRARGLRPRHRRRPSRMTSCASVRQPVQLVRQGFGDGTDAAV